LLGRFATRCVPGRNSLALTLNAKRTHPWRHECQQQVSPCAAHLLLRARTCRNEELRCNIRYSSVQGLSGSLLRDGRTGQREEQLCSGGQTSADPCSNRERQTTITWRQRQGAALSGIGVQGSEFRVPIRDFWLLNSECRQRVSSRSS
jgi:hypothetical protein